MKAREALRALAEVSGAQWGLVTAAQAAALGVGRLELSRLAQAGDLERLAQGVYKDPGAPSASHLELRATWLSTAPAELAEDRLKHRPADVTVSGESAATLHNIGDLRAMHHELTTPTRRQTQRSDLRYRMRKLNQDDVTVRDGLPVTTVERTVADLIEAQTDLSLVASALADAARNHTIDLDRLAELLSPLAARNGHKRGDGDALVRRMLELAGLDRAAIASRIAANEAIGALVAERYLRALPAIDVSGLIDTAAMQRIVSESTRATAAEIASMSVGLSKAVAEQSALAGARIADAILRSSAGRMSVSSAEVLEAADAVDLGRGTSALPRPVETEERDA